MSHATYILNWLMHLHAFSTQTPNEKFLSLWESAHANNKFFLSELPTSKASTTLIYSLNFRCRFVGCSLGWCTQLLVLCHNRLHISSLPCTISYPYHQIRTFIDLRSNVYAKTYSISTYSFNAALLQRHESSAFQFNALTVCFKR